MNLCAESATERIEQLKGKVDVVVNLAGVVDFDPPVNESFETNVYGTQHLIELVQAARHEACPRFHLLCCWKA